MAAKTVDEYIAGLEGWKSDVGAELQRIVRAAAPDAKESIKWAQPVYESDGPFSYFKAFKNSVNFGFWRGVAFRRRLDSAWFLLQPILFRLHGANQFRSGRV